MFVEVLQNVLNPSSLLLILTGVVLGNIFGAIPGLNTPIAIALVLPITMIMDPVPSVCILMGIYMGGVSGGLISVSYTHLDVYKRQGLEGTAGQLCFPEREREGKIRRRAYQGRFHRNQRHDARLSGI